MLAEAIAVSMANNTKVHPRIQIPRHNGIFSLFCIQKNINIHHLINAHNANIQTISFPTKFASLAQTSIIQSIKINIQTTNKKDMY